MGRNFVLSFFGIVLMGCQLGRSAELAFPDCSIVPESGNEIVLLPHHLLVESIIRDMYESLDVNSWDSVVVVSPDHFYAGDEHISPAGEEEHGFTVHRDFVEEFWPEAGVEGFMIKTSVTKNELIDFADELREQENTLFIFSVDFSHYLPGDIAYIHDLRSMDILEARDIASAASIEVDSPATIEVMLRLLEVQNQKLLIQKNTNPSLDTGIRTFDNTTHVFACSSSAKSDQTFERSISTSMYFAESEDWYKGKTGEDRYLYGYDQTFFDQGGTDRAVVTNLQEDTEETFIFRYLDSTLP